MSVMFRNSNADVEKELAVEDYKAHRVRNRMAVLAVTQTTIWIYNGAESVFRRVARTGRGQLQHLRR